MEIESTTPEKLEPGFADMLLESIAEGVFTLNRDGRITFWNPSMEKITGYTAREAIGNTCAFMQFNHCFGRVCPTGIQECGIYKHGRLDGRECLIRHKDGADIPVLKNARVVKDVDGKITGVVETITDLSELHKARRQADEANRRLGEKHKLHNIIGKSDAINQVFSAINAAAASEATILIQGESGTGKELVAGAIHYNSSRSGNPFVIVNCSALSESLLESELFGHVKGAFTGAVRDRIGRFEEAAGGTLFLDEIGEISPFIQIKLLRVLQERVIERVGESKQRKIDIRIIAATNKDLYQLVSSGTFREDLYYRLKVFPIHLPPLRKRKDDVPLLISHFITAQNKKTGKKIKGASQSAMRTLMDYHWPGNIRELENAIEHAFVVCEGEYIDIFDLPVEIRQFEYCPAPVALQEETAPLPRPKEKVTREFLLDVLEASGWNKAEVGRRIGLSRAAVWKYMKKWDIPLKQPPSL